MRREDVQSLIRRIPPESIPKVVLVIKGGVNSINIDMVFKLEPDYLVVRGREAGTNDDGRGFFVPYDEIAYMKLEQVVKVGDLKGMYGEALSETDDITLETETRTPSPSGVNTPTPQSPQDPASVARQNLLDRIRATRTSAGVPRAK